MIRKTCRRVGKCVGRAWAYPYLGRSKKMGCLKLPYYEKEDRPNFLGLWKKSESSKSCDNYYPFGLAFNAYSRERSVPNLYKYNGKEEQDELDLAWLDYGARMYQSELGRWMTIDPMSETSRKWSPYTYAYNNPLIFVDPDGMQNVIYLYANKDENGDGPSRKELRQLKSGLKQWLKSNNFDTKVKILNHVPNAKQLDKSDHFVSVGTTSSNEALNKKSDETGFGRVLGAIDGPGVTSNLSTKENEGKGSITFMNIEALRKQYASSDGMPDNFTGTSYSQYLGGVAFHEAGHSAGLLHSTPGYTGGDPTTVDPSKGSYDAHDERRWSFMSIHMRWDQGHTFNSNMGNVTDAQRGYFTNKFSGTPIVGIRRNKR
jgi:RHS repeat-associated protein